jgi:hypothetical protein
MTLTEGSMLKGPKAENNLVPTVAPPAPVPVDEVKQREDLVKSMTDKYNQLGQEGYLITQMMNNESKTGRNNRCHCGSMKKYKNCCIKLYEEKRSRYIELVADMSGVAEEIKAMHKEIKEIKEELKDVETNE